LSRFKPVSPAIAPPHGGTQARHLLARLLLERARFIRVRRPVLKNPQTKSVVMIAALWLACFAPPPAAAATHYIGRVDAGRIGLDAGAAASDADIDTDPQRVIMPADASGSSTGMNERYADAYAADDADLDAYTADGRYGGRIQPVEPSPARLDAPTRTPVSVSVPAGMLVAGLGLLGMIARRRTFLR
jgi:hypothetical protein